MTTRQLELQELIDIGLLVNTDLTLHCKERVNFILLTEQHGRIVHVSNTHKGEMVSAIKMLLETAREQAR